MVRSDSGAVVGADIPGHTIIGDCNTIGHHAVVGVKCQDMKYKVCTYPLAPLVFDQISCHHWFV